MSQNKNKILNAQRGWLAVGALALTYELACPPGELLSEGVDRAIDRHPVLVPAAIGYLALHLCNRLPESMDLLHQGSIALKKGRDGTA